MSVSIYSIYKITNLVENKAYIGFTSHNPPEIRWKKHIRDANRGKGFLLHKAIRKYNTDNFSFDVIYQSLDDSHCLNIMEEYFIQKFHSHVSENGYNLTYGGDSPMHRKCHTNETKRLMRESAKKRPPISQETKRKLSESKLGKNNPMFNSGISTQLKKIHECNKIKIVCNETQQIFESMKTAGIYFNMDPSNISRQIAGKIKSTKGYTFHKIAQNQ